MKKIVRLTENDLVRLVKRVIKEQSGSRRLEYYKDLIGDVIGDDEDYVDWGVPREKYPSGVFNIILKHAYSEGDLTDDELEELHDYANKVYSSIIRSDSVKHYTPDEAYFFRIVKPKLIQNGFVETQNAIKKKLNREFELVYGEYPNDVHVEWHWHLPGWKQYTVYIGFGNKEKNFKLSDNSSENESVANNAVKYALSLKK